jgi:hypothetical protein
MIFSTLQFFLWVSVAANLPVIARRRPWRRVQTPVTPGAVDFDLGSPPRKHPDESAQWYSWSGRSSRRYQG